MKVSGTPVATGGSHLSRRRWFRFSIAAGIAFRLAIAPLLSYPFDMSVWFSIWERFWSAGINPLYRNIYGLFPTLLLTADAVPVQFAFGFLGISNVAMLQLSFRLLLLPFDLLACFALRKLASLLGAAPPVPEIVAVLWFWNPLVIYVTFVHGQLPIAAVALVILGLVYLREEKPVRAMASVALAVCFHYVYVIVAVPVLLMALRSRGAHGRRGRVLTAALAVLVANFVPFALHPSSISNLYSQIGSRTGGIPLSIPNWSAWSVLLYLNHPEVASVWPLLFLFAVMATAWRLWRDGFLKHDFASTDDWISLIRCVTGALMVFLGLWSVVEPQSMLLGLPFLFLMVVVNRSKRWLYAALVVSVADLAVVYAWISPPLFLTNVLPTAGSIPSLLSAAPDVLMALLGTLNGIISISGGAWALFWRPRVPLELAKRPDRSRGPLVTNIVVSTVVIAVMISPLPAALPLLAAGPTLSVSPDLPRLNVLTFEGSGPTLSGAEQRFQIPVDLASFSSRDSWRWESVNLTLVSGGNGTLSSFGATGAETMRVDPVGLSSEGGEGLRTWANASATWQKPFHHSLEIPPRVAGLPRAGSGGQSRYAPFRTETQNRTQAGSQAANATSGYDVLLNGQCRYQIPYMGPSSSTAIDPRCLVSSTDLLILSGPVVASVVVVIEFNLSPVRVCCGLDARMAFAALGVVGYAGYASWVTIGLTRDSTRRPRGHPLRIALVCKGPLDSGGGIEECCKLLVRGLSSIPEVQTTVYHWRMPGDERGTRAGPSEVSIATLHVPGIEELLYSAVVGLKLLFADVDIVHAHGEVGFFPALVRLLRPDLQLVVSYHGLQLGLLRSRSGIFRDLGVIETSLGFSRCLLVAVMEATEGLLCDKAIADSEGVARELREMGVAAPSKTVVIENVPDTTRLAHRPPREEARRQLGLPQDGVLGLFVGSDWRRKGLPRALQITAECREAGLPVTLVVVGLSTLPASLMRFAEFAIPVGRVGVEELPVYYAAASFLLLPTLYEGYSMTILESLASGLPVVTTHASNLVPNRFRHVLFVEDLRGDSLVQALRALASLAPAHAGFEDRFFQLDDFVEHHMQVYRDVVRRAER